MRDEVRDSWFVVRDSRIAKGVPRRIFSSLIPHPSSLCVALLLWLVPAIGSAAGQARYEVTGRAFIDDAPSTGTVLLAKREVPWRGESLAERIPLSAPAGADLPAGGATPGLRVARERLAVRTVLRDRLRAKAESLPAADPLPGASAGATVGEFAKREPVVRAALDAMLAGGIAERHIRVERSVVALVEGRVELASLADAVLAVGGGRRIDSSEIERRAAEQAMEKAREELARAIAKHSVAGGGTVQTWAKGNNAAFQRLIREAQIVSSGPETTPRGRSWTVKLALTREQIKAATTPAKKPKSKGPALPGTRK